VWVVHDAQHIPKLVNHGSRYEPLIRTGRDRLVFLRSHPQQLFECRCDVIDMPERDGSARLGRRAGVRPAAVDQPQLVLVITNAELRAGEPTVRSGALEVRRDAQQLRVSPLCRVQLSVPWLIVASPRNIADLLRRFFR
jgi:hypothetical protein